MWTCIQKFTVLICVKFESGKKNMIEGKEKMQTKNTFENDSDDAIPESVSKLNKIIPATVPILDV